MQTPYRSATLPTPLARPHTPAHAPSLDDIRRKVVKFSMPDEGKSSMIAVADCTRGAEVLERALRKLKGADDAGLRQVLAGGALDGRRGAGTGARWADGADAGFGAAPSMTPPPTTFVAPPW